MAVNPITGGAVSKSAAAGCAALVCLFVVSSILGAGSAVLAEVRWNTVVGKVTVRAAQYPEESDLEDRDYLLEAELELEISAQLSDRWQLTMIPLLRGDAGNKTASEFRLLEDEALRPAATFRELHLTYYGDSFELAVGKQTFSWGTGDAVRPTDNLNPVDLLDLPTAKKIGVPALSIFWFGDKVDFEIVALPFFVPDRLPGTRNRWAIVPDSIAEDFRRGFGFTPRLGDVERSLLAHDLDNVQAGVRLSSSSLVTGWDLELSAFRGFDPFGLLLSEIRPPFVDLTFVYPEFWEVGGAFSTTQGRFEWHGEVALHQTVREELDDDYLQYIFGFNYTISVGRPSLDRVLFGLEYLGEEVTRDHPTGGDLVQTGFDRVLTDTAVGRVVLSFSERTLLEVGGTFNFADGGYLARVAVRHTAFDALEVQAGFDLLEGDMTSFYGNWDNNDRFFVFSTYSF